MVFNNRASRITVFALGSALCLMQFQNCAGTGAGDGSQVHLIDGSSKQGVQFQEVKMQLQDEASSASIVGDCSSSKDGESLSWWISSNNNQNILPGGNAACDGGHFDLNVTDASDWVCGVAYEVHVISQYNEASSTTVVKRCQPLAQASLPSSVRGQTCSLEYSLSDQALCQAVCYAGGMVVSEQNRPINDCSSLISQLAGQ